MPQTEPQSDHKLMQCAKILLEPAKFNALDKYIKSKWELGARSSDVATMGADRKRHLQNVVSILILKIGDEQAQDEQAQEIGVGIPHEGGRRRR